MASSMKRPLQALVLFSVFALFAWGVIGLAMLRFEQGEPYAPYSSFRADPLGCRGLYGALDSLPGINARRHLRPLSKLEGGEGQLVMVLGMPISGLASGELQKELLRLADAGSRVMVAAQPLSSAQLRALSGRNDMGDDNCGCPDEENADAKSNGADQSADSGDAKGDKADKVVSSDDNSKELDSEGEVVDWKLNLDRQQVNSELQTFLSVRQQAPKTLPERLTIHTPLTFRAEHDDWIPVYTVNDMPVIVERSWGRGSLVVCAESYLFSNESLRSEPPAEFVSWMLGDAREVVFAETHLGVEESSSLMMLIRRYRMDGILLALFVIAALAVWKNALPLVPPPPVAATGAATRDHFSGLLNLLVRHVPLPDLGEACHREWARGLRRYGYPSVEKRQQIGQLVKAEHNKPGNERRPLALYRKICQILNERTL